MQNFFEVVYERSAPSPTLSTVGERSENLGVLVPEEQLRCWLQH
jgi:hypothetical protein